MEHRHRAAAWVFRTCASVSRRCSAHERGSRSRTRPLTAHARPCHVVCVTAYDEYAVAAFDEGAVDYVLKPPMPERIAKVVARLKTRIALVPLDLTGLLAKLAARNEAVGPLKWIRASLGP